MAGSTIGVVQVILSARDDSLAREFRKATGEIEQFRRGFEKVSGIIQTFAGAAVVSMAVDAFKAMREESIMLTKAGLAFQDGLARQADNLGISARAMAAFAVVEGRADMAAGSLAASLAKMQQYIQGATKFGSEADKTLRGLGVSIADIGAAGADEQFRMISDAIAKVANAGERSALAMEIFGKQGKELVSTISAGRQAFDDAAAAAEKYGIALSKADSARVNLANNKIKESELIAEGMKSQVAAANAVDAIANTYMDRIDDERKAARARIAKDEAGFWTRTIAIYKDAIFGGEAQPYTWAIKRAQMDMADAVKVTTALKVVGADDAAAAAEREVEAQRRQAIEMKRTQDIAASYAKVFSEMKSATFAIDDEASRRRISEWLKGEGKLLMSDDPVKWSWTLGEFVKDKEFDKRQREAQRVFSDSPAPSWQIDQRQKLVGSAASDPRVQYERDVYDAIQSGKRMQQAMEMARSSQLLLGQIRTPDVDERVLYESEVDRLVAENRQRSRDAEAQLARQYQMTEMQGYSDFFGNLATLTAAASKESLGMFYANKALMMAQAEINSWMAYSNVMGNYMLGMTVGPVMQQVMAWTALAAGQVAVVQIAAQQPGARANGGSVSRGGLYQVNERGPEMLTIGDKSFLMMGNRDGSVTPNSGRGGPAGVTVHVHNAPGTTARIEQSGTPEAPRLDVIIERVDQAIASGIRSGSGSTARAIQSTYGVNRARGAS